jgi:hypothetical protein
MDFYAKNLFSIKNLLKKQIDKGGKIYLFDNLKLKKKKNYIDVTFFFFGSS